MNWSCVDYLWIIVMQLFALSFWRHPFTAEDPLVSKRASFSKSVPTKKQTHLQYILDGQRVSIFSANFHFRVSCIVTFFIV